MVRKIVTLSFVYHTRMQEHQISESLYKLNHFFKGIRLMWKKERRNFIFLENLSFFLTYWMQLNPNCQWLGRFATKTCCLPIVNITFCSRITKSLRISSTTIALLLTKSPLGVKKWASFKNCVNFLSSSKIFDLWLWHKLTNYLFYQVFYIVILCYTVLRIMCLIIVYELKNNIR